MASRGLPVAAVIDGADSRSWPSCANRGETRLVTSTMVARLDAQNAVDFRREADLESPNSIGADPFPQRFRGVAAATRGYAMLGGLGGLRRPLGSASRQGP